MTRLKSLAIAVLLVVSIFAVAFVEPVVAQESPQEKTVEGISYLTVTGSLFATEVTVTGYEANTKTLYLTLVFYNNTGTDVTTVTYNVTVYDHSTGDKIGTKLTSSESWSATPSKSYHTVKNYAVSLTTDLPAAYRIVVTVESYG